MKPKAVLKLAVDVFMTIALLFLMGYQFWGEAAHEWIGAGMIIVFIGDHILNLGWHRNIFKGRYTAIRVVTLCIDILVLLAMLAQMYSGIVMSRSVFAFLPINGGMSIARKLHILGAYWGFILMSLHVGLHWNRIVRMMGNKFSSQQTSKIRWILLSAMGILITGYGIFSFVKRDFFTYLFLKSAFVFLNYDESKILFYIDYLALMGLCIFIAHYSSKLCKCINKGRRKRQ